MIWVTEEFLKTEGLDSWVYDFSKLISFFKKPLIVRDITGKVVRDEYFKPKPHDPKKWISGKEMRREAESFHCWGLANFVNALREKSLESKS